MAAQHVRSCVQSNDVDFTSGTGFMVDQERYNRHMQTMKDGVLLFPYELKFGVTDQHD